MANTPDVERVLTNITVERQASAMARLENTTVYNFGWQNVTVTIKDRATKQPKAILEKVNGFVNAGKTFQWPSNSLTYSYFQVKCVP
jgi:Fe-S cluster assembly scaffold protein SufB